MLIIATSSSDFVQEAKIKDTFNVVIQVPSVSSPAHILKVVSDLKVFRTGEMKLLKDAVQNLPSKFEMGIGQLLEIIDSVQDSDEIVSRSPVLEKSSALALADSQKLHPAETLREKAKVAKFIKNLEVVLQHAPLYNSIYA